MKKIFIVLAMPILFGCSAEKIAECNCGLVVSDNVKDYSVVIRNQCSGKEQKFYLQAGDWINAQVGSDYCINNVSNW